MNGSVVASSRTVNSPAATGNTASSHHCGPLDSDSRNPSMPTTVAENSATPGRSRSVDAGARRTPSGGSHHSARTSPTTASGMFTAKMPRQPAPATRNPPSTGPSAALVEFVTEMVASVAAGGLPPASRRIVASPAGKAAEVPTACTTRQPTSQPNPGESSAATPVTSTTASPAQYTRRGPYRSATRPISGCPTHAAR